MRKFTVLFGVLFFMIALLNPVGAYDVVYCTNCSNQFLQAMDRVTNVEQLGRLWAQYNEDVTQTAQQIRMVQQNIEQYQNMIQNTDNLNENTLRRIAGDFKRIAHYLGRLKTQKGDTEALEQVWVKTFPDYAEIEGIAAKSPEDYQQGWEDWSRFVDRSALATFQVSGKQLEELSNSDELDGHIQELLNSPEGRMQALQAANQLTAIQIREARELRALLATQTQSDVQAAQKAEKMDQSDKALYLKHLGGKALDRVGVEQPMPGADNKI